MKKIILDLTGPIKDIVINEDTKIFGLFLGKYGLTSINKFNITFAAKEIFLDLRVKAVMADNSVFDFSPNLMISGDQIGIQANLKINVLNISQNSTISSTPAMEIQEPDIKASHSLAVNTFNNDQLTYLYSRGLDHKQAEEVLINSFIADIIKEIT